MSNVIRPNSKLSVIKNVKDGICSLAFEGDIDEDFSYEQLLQERELKYLIDFNGILMINSCGIREWISFVEKLGQGVKIIYVNCPQIIVQQINMVEGFLPDNAYVHTFFAPYYSEETDEEKKILLKSEDIVDMKAPEIKDDQGNLMEFDAHEKQYFYFLSKQK